MKVDGQIFKPGAAIVHDAGSPDRDPEVGVISTIYIVNGSVVHFKADLFRATFEKHFRAFELQPYNKSAMFAYEQLPLYIPIHPRTCRVLPQHPLIIMPFYLTSCTNS